MGYSTVANVRVVSGLTDDTLVSDALITAKISYADSLINSKIGNRYKLPITVACALLIALSEEMATVFLLMDQYSEESGDTDKGYQKRLDAVYEILNDISTGKNALFDDTGAELPQAKRSYPRFHPNDASSDPSATDSTEPEITRARQF